MLTKKELDYVNTPINRVPFPGQNYALNTGEKLTQAFELYKKDYQDKEYDIILSNGESLTFEILKKNLCHMLGIDFKLVSNLLSKEFQNFGGGITTVAPSFEILELLINRIDEIIKHDATNKERFLNYFKVMIKCTIFISFSNFSSFDFGVLNFNKDSYDETKYGRFSSNANTLLFTRSNEAVTPYYIMGLKYLEEELKSIVETLYAPLEINQFVDKQELVIPTQILVTDNSTMELTKLTATSKEKLEILKMYQSILASTRVPSNINIMGDYESMLMDYSNKLTKH